MHAGQHGNFLLVGLLVPKLGETAQAKGNLQVTKYLFAEKMIFFIIFCKTLAA